MRLNLVTLLGALALALSAAPASAERACIPGQQFLRPCVSGGNGVQICSDDGARLGPCSCAPTPPAAQTPAPAPQPAQPVEAPKPPPAAPAPTRPVYGVRPKAVPVPEIEHHELPTFTAPTVDLSKWREDDPVPFGYHVESLPTMALLLPGSALFLASWGTAIVVAAAASVGNFGTCSNALEVSAIPLVGPAISGLSGCGGKDAAGWLLLYGVGDTLLQLSGFGAAVVGLILSRPVLVENRHVQLRWAPAPGGLGLTFALDLK